MKRFEDLIKEKNDEELIIILCRAEEYQPEFIEVVKKELREFRNIQTYKDFFKSKSDEELINYCNQTYQQREKFIGLAKKELDERSIYLDYKEPKTGILLEQTDCLGQTVSPISYEKTAPSASEQSEEAIVNQIYEFAANLLFKEKQGKQDVINELINNGIDAENAEIVVSNLLSSRNQRANKNMLYGALWCIGGTIATLADFGYIFWGAIVFGAIQFFAGLAKKQPKET